MRLMVRVFWLAVLVLGAPAWSAAADPAKKSAVDLLPPSMIAFVEMPAPAKLLDTVLDHSLAAKLRRQPDFQQALDSPDMENLREEVERFERAWGIAWRPALGELTGGGITVGVELGTQGVIVLTRARDEKLLATTRDAALGRLKEAGRAPRETTYQAVTCYAVDELHYAAVGPWLIATNKNRLLQMAIDNALEDDRPSLAGERQFVEARKLKQGEPTVWAYVDLTILRVTGLARNVLDKKSDNPAVELLIGGILGAIPDAPYVTAALSIEPERIAASAALPHDPAKIGPRREYYFGPEGKGASPALLAPRGTLLSLSTYRDFAQMWRRAPDLFDDNVNAGLAEAESGLATFFSGKSFPEDILGRIEPGLQWVLTRQTFAEGEIAPEIKLPATALVLRLKEPEETARQFKITYQSLIGFLNIVGAMNGAEALEQETERIGGVTLVSATYLPPREAARRSAPIHFNASPTVAFVKDACILSSTRGLALELAQGIEKGAADRQAGVNTALRISGEELRALLADNRAQLVAQNQADKGHGGAEAEGEVDLLLSLLGALRETTLRLTTHDGSLAVEWELRLAP
jgi:hypothetical protein